MNSLKKQLLEFYQLKDSIKNYKGYKVASPEKTISEIEKKFNKIDLNVSYNPFYISILEKFYPFQSGNAELTPKMSKEMILIKTNGKGVTPILSKASAYAELIERFAGYGLADGQIQHYLSQIKFNDIIRNKSIKNDILNEIAPFN